MSKSIGMICEYLPKSNILLLQTFKKKLKENIVQKSGQKNKEYYLFN